eukprot:TRINITY_DN1525_c0_g1_i1.p1 TRINITY_DN1525_c0_g1~~TRINITY_DN1525_c0_g1_i1.p1  ORF type:complete len:212 (-),score=45.38 TRINITY_DN1525_c0_g1_i1:383-1018(-)
MSFFTILLFLAFFTHSLIGNDVERLVEEPEQYTMSWSNSASTGLLSGKQHIDYIGKRYRMQEFHTSGIQNLVVIEAEKNAFWWEIDYNGFVRGCFDVWGQVELPVRWSAHPKEDLWAIGRNPEKIFAYRKKGESKIVWMNEANEPIQFVEVEKEHGEDSQMSFQYVRKLKVGEPAEEHFWVPGFCKKSARNEKNLPLINPFWSTPRVIQPS